MKKAIFLVAFGAVTFAGGFLLAGHYTHTRVKISKFLTVGTISKGGEVTIQSDGTDKILSGKNSSGTEVCSFDADGNLVAVGLTSSGAVSFTGNITLGDTVTDTVTVNGSTVMDASFKPDAVTADPCTGTGYGPGSIFWNATSGYLCECDASTDDLKVVDESTACF
jgi:hypothetical protein